MDPLLIGVIGVIALLVLLYFGMQIGIAMSIVGFVGYIACVNLPAALGVFKTVPFNTSSSYSLSVIPLFVLMGQFAFYSKISSDLYNVCYKWLGRLRGGLGVSTVVASGLFGAICGSATATTATMGVVALPEMQKYGYKDSLSCGAIAAGGTLGILIPPSVAFILYGTVSEQSIGAMFASGVIPGIILVILFAIAILVVTKIDPEAGPKGEQFTLREKLQSLKGAGPFIILFIVILGGIFGGFFTASEGGAIGAFVSFIFMALRRKATWANIKASLGDTINTTAMIFIIMIGAYIFGAFLTVSRMPAELAKWTLSLDVPSGFIIIAIILVFGVMGCFIDALPLIVLLVPIFLPIVTELGMSPIWFGVIIVLVTQLGLITPPVGMCCYVMAGVAKDVPLFTIFRGILPFIFAMVTLFIILMIFPNLTTYLPHIFYGAEMAV
ncbi:MAG: TRAP transporter large permease [Anaerovoracaceae bacterium]|jgi:C4-dicarboxylate transporter DctM subunit